MIAHVVMFRPPATLTASDREALLDAMRHAFSNIPEITRARVGRRKLIGRGYEALMAEHLEWLAILEFDNESALKTYLEHPAHEEPAKVAVHVRDSDLDDALDLSRGDREPVGDLLRGRVDRHVLTEPRERRVHQNCLRSRGSFRQSSRRSGIPCRSTAIRSSPQPKAKPV